MTLPPIDRKKPLRIRVEGNTAIVTLVGGKYTVLMDAEDIHMLDVWKFSVHPTKKYVMLFGSRSVKPTPHICLSRLVTNAPKGRVVDHINHDTLDNRKANLRICTTAENARNSEGCCRTRRGRYKGVYFFNKKGCVLTKPWTAHIRHNGKLIFLGRYATDTEAALAYNEKVKELFGEYGFLNEV